MNLSLHPQFWWFLSRATGVTAWIASLGSCLVGLALATRTLGNRPRGPWLLDLHRGLAGVTAVFTIGHMVGLVADSYVHFGAADLLVPLATDWKPLAVGAGIIGFWVLVAVQVTSLMMKRLPKKLWHAIHLSSYLAAVSVTAHAFTAGTDAQNPAFIAVAVVSVAMAAFMFTYRVAGPSKPKRTIPARRLRPDAAEGQTGS